MASRRLKSRLEGLRSRSPAKPDWNPERLTGGISASRHPVGGILRSAAAAGAATIALNARGPKGSAHGPWGQTRGPEGPAHGPSSGLKPAATTNNPTG